MSERELLLGYGLRVSRQRIKIIALLKRYESPFTVKTIYNILLRDGGVCFATVYKTIAVMEAAGIVECVNSGSVEREFAYRSSELKR